MAVGGLRSSLSEGVSATEVEQHLQQVLASDAFKSSRGCRDFLSYVVTRTLAGDENSIKERTIATEVFGRPADYDTSENSFVRVKAVEVRRRLSAYLEHQPAGNSLRIELPLGSYVPRFVRLQPVPAPETPPVKDVPSACPRRRVKYALVGAFLVGCLAALAVAAYRSSKTPMDEFWEPVTRSPAPLAIYVPMGTHYEVISQAAERTPPPFATSLTGPGGEKLLMIPRVHRLGIGAAQGAIRFAALCGAKGKLFVVRTGEDFSFADLRSQPSVLFGAFSSRWTAEMNNDSRFKLILEHGHTIVDGNDPSRRWHAVRGDAPGRPSEDYAIAGRMFDARSGQLVLIAAGLSTYGTQAAAEFLTDPRRIAELAKRAPGPLDKGNFQIVLHTKIVGNTTSAPRIVDVHFW